MALVYEKITKFFLPILIHYIKVISSLKQLLIPSMKELSVKTFIALCFVNVVSYRILINCATYLLQFVFTINGGNV